MAIQVNEAIDLDTGEIVSVRRTSAGVYVDGLYVKGLTSTFRTVASIQQPTPAQLKVVKEGERTSDMRTIFSRKPLRGLDDYANTVADVLLYKGKEYKIVGLGDWDTFGYTFAIGARQ